MITWAYWAFWMARGEICAAGENFFFAPIDFHFAPIISPPKPGANGGKMKTKSGGKQFFCGGNLANF